MVQRSPEVGLHRGSQRKVPEAAGADEGEAQEDQGITTKSGGKGRELKTFPHKLLHFLRVFSCADPSKLNKIKWRRMTLIDQLLLLLSQEITELRDLLRILPEMEKLIMMPIRPTQQQQQQHQQHQHAPPPSNKPSPATADVSSCNQAAVLSREERRHDSGSDSGTELVEEAGGGGGCSGSGGGAGDNNLVMADNNLPQEAMLE